MHYTKRIRQLRELRFLSQKEVAALLNVGQKTYSDYELGKTRIPLDSIILLAKLIMSAWIISAAYPMFFSLFPRHSMLP